MLFRSRYVTVLQLEGNISHRGDATVGRQILSDLVPPGWALDQQSLPVKWIHKTSGATCPEFPFVMELSVRIFAVAHIDRYTVSIWIPWQCTLTDLAKLLPLRGVHSHATRSSVTFFTRLPSLCLNTPCDPLLNSFLLRTTSQTSPHSSPTSTRHVSRSVRPSFVLLSGFVL